MVAIGATPVDNSSERTFWSYLGFAIFWAVSLASALPFFGPVLPLGLRIAFSVAFVVIGVSVALLVDKFKVAFFVRTTDRGPFDWYTIAHGMAGVMLGAWFLPLWWVLVITIAWEIFEATVPGWGKYEPFLNRVIDVTVAAFGWLIVTGVTGLATGGSLPLLLAPGSLVTQ